MVDRVDKMLDLQQLTLDRVKRVETRLVQLMLYVEANPKVRYGAPQPKKQEDAHDVETEPRGIGNTSHQCP